MDAVPNKRTLSQPKHLGSSRQNNAHDTSPANTRAEDTDHPDMVRQVFAIVKRWKKFILTAAFGAGGLALLLALTTTPSYLAKALLVLELRGVVAESNRGSRATNIVPTAVQEAALETHITSLLSESNLRRALDALPELTSGKSQAARSKSLGWTSGFIESLLDKIVEMRSTVGGFVRGSVGSEPRSADVVRLTRNLRIDQERRSNVISIGYWSPDPKEAAKVANTIARIYVDDLSTQIRQDAERELTWLTNRITEVQKELTEGDTEVQVFRQVHALPETAGSDEIQQQIVETAKQVALFKTNAANSRARLSDFVKTRKASGDAKKLAQISGSGQLAELVRQESALSGSQREEDQSRLADIRRAVDREVDAAENNLRAEVRGADSQVMQGDGKLRLLQQAAHDSIGSQAELKLLERKAAALSQLYDDLLRRKETFAEHAQTPTPDIRILAEAWPPIWPASISRFFVVPPVIIAAALLACFIAIVRDRLANALYREAEVEGALHLPCMGAIPELDLRKSGPIETLLFECRHSRYARAIRAVAAATTFRDHGADEPKVIMVTSAQVADGKSAFARSIAVAMAQLSRRVLLIAFDSSVLPSFNPAGSAECDGAWADPSRGRILASTTRSILGAVEPNASQGIDCISLSRDDLFELLTNDQFAQALSKLRESYEIIIMDAPSVLEGPETCMLVGMAEEVLFVIRCGYTNRIVARRAVQRVQAAAPADDSLRVFTVLTRSSGRDLEGM